MSLDTLENRISELESVVTFQEHTISSLSSELFIQQEKVKEIFDEYLQEKKHRMSERLSEFMIHRTFEVIAIKIQSGWTKW